jgi:iron complex transport system ATP-binding protein
MNEVELRNLVVDAGGRRIVDGVSFDVALGEWLSLLGPNGAGKTTILRVLAGIRSYRGVVTIRGRELGSLRRREAARLVSLVPQIPIVPAAMTVAEYVLLGRTPHLGALSQEGASDRAAAAEAIASLELEEFAERELGSLSGGELQRAVIARSLAQSAPLLLLDEPTSALDLGHQQQVLELVERLRRDHELTVIAAMHDLTLAAQYGERVVLLDRGRVAADGAPRDVLTSARLGALYGAKVRVLDDGGGLAVVPVRT